MNKSLKRLVIDTATPYLYIALYEDNVLVDSIYQKGNNDHSVTLMDNIAKMFDKASWKIQDLAAVIVGIGPGSYTGVRIGVVVAKMFAWSHNIPVFKISTPALLASGADNGVIFAYVDARRNQAFGGVFEKTDETLVRLKADTYADLTTMLDSWTYDHPVNAVMPDLNVVLNSELLEAVDNVHDLSPVYLRKTEAERNQEQNK